MEVVEQVTSRDKTIVKTGLIGIVTNAILAAIKAVVGFASGSIAIILDAVNNLSDALSSVITIVGIKIAGKSPDKEHPFGYGRVEYLTAIVIGVIILYTGGTSVAESAKKIISPITKHPKPRHYLAYFDRHFGCGQICAWSLHAKGRTKGKF